MEFKGKLFIKGKVKVRTGLHIGGSTSSLDIGGVDLPVLKDAEGVPFIPGSSLKGKMRSLLEWKQGKFSIKMDGKDYDDLEEFWEAYLDKVNGDETPDVKGSPCSCGKCDVCKLFGVPADKGGIYPQRLIVRDAHLDVEAFRDLFGEDNEFLETKYGEVKYENTIDRLTSAANPRQIERVPAGAEFEFELVFNLFGEDDEKLLKTLFSGMKLLEDDYLGGHGSRGYGQIAFKDIKVQKKTKSCYEMGESVKGFGPLDDLADEDKINKLIKEAVGQGES